TSSSVPPSWLPNETGESPALAGLSAYDTPGGDVLPRISVTRADFPGGGDQGRDTPRTETLRRGLRGALLERAGGRSIRSDVGTPLAQGPRSSGGRARAPASPNRRITIRERAPPVVRSRRSSLRG